MKIAVNTISTKKNAGGAYQIACNFLVETVKVHNDIDWYYITSKDVDELVGAYFEEIKGLRYFVFPTQPDFIGSYKSVKKELEDWEEKYRPDLIYTISSPCYFSFKANEVMRFANAWVTNPNKYAWMSLSLREKIQKFLYCWNQRRMLKKGQYFITQSRTVGDGLIKIVGCDKSNVRIVPNVLPLFFESSRVDKSLSKEWIDVACIAAQSPHKNLSIIPDVLLRLRDEYAICNVRFHVTIPYGIPLENKIILRCKKLGLEKNIINHGRCTQSQLCEIYNQCSICFLPTLLETFSATALEAMKFELKIVATDFAFNREVIANAGIYYNPMDAVDAAAKIVEVVRDEKMGISLLENAKSILPLYEGYKMHYEKTVQFLKECVSQHIKL